MTELQQKGLEAVAELKSLATELFPLTAVPYMKWVQAQARRHHDPRLALAFVRAQTERLERQGLSGGTVA